MRKALGVMYVFLTMAALFATGAPAVDRAVWLLAHVKGLTTDSERWLGQLLAMCGLVVAAVFCLWLLVCAIRYAKRQQDNAT